MQQLRVQRHGDKAGTDMNDGCKSSILAGEIQAWLAEAHKNLPQNSWRALRSDIRLFGDWANRNGFKVMPADPSAVVSFLRHKADEGKSASSLARAASSISRLHRMAGLPSPALSSDVKNELGKLRGRKTPGLSGSWPLRLRLPEGELKDPTGISIMLLKPRLERPRDYRNWALIIMAYVTQLSRTKLLAINWEDLEENENGSTLLYVRDQRNGARVRAIILGPNVSQVIKSWRQMSNYKSGPVFRRFSGKNPSGSNMLLDERLSPQSVNLIYQSMVDKQFFDIPGSLRGMKQETFREWQKRITSRSVHKGRILDI
ncbi:site-specific integrase [Sphingomonas solaris]|uniref:Core-binding (CB) domain-containing protein n=1 Tax=Alterirhizorhabdus solaris TaxID=2529389 RepID=A0A558RD66_9SPHN|nr:hypothetical protein FOY91_02275 [Sphingomonas solaris]